MNRNLTKGSRRNSGDHTSQKVGKSRYLYILADEGFNDVLGMVVVNTKENNGNSNRRTVLLFYKKDLLLYEM